MYVSKVNDGHVSDIVWGGELNGDVRDAVLALINDRTINIPGTYITARPYVDSHSGQPYLNANLWTVRDEGGKLRISMGGLLPDTPGVSRVTHWPPR